MLRNLGGSNPYTKSPQDGGPFCISFHKSASTGWSASCAASDPDARHIHGFVTWALSTFPIEPNAVTLHGFFSGAILFHNLMSTSYRVELLVASAVPYAGDAVRTPPTTKAAYLIPHGTHNNFVPYMEGWTQGRALASCNCNRLFPAPYT